MESCIKSIKSQKFRDFEAVIIDDGSTDETYSTCCTLVENDKRFRIIRQKNTGVSGARNRGIEISNGLYICFMDVDDIIAEDYLYNMWHLMEQNNADMIIQSFQVVENGMVKRRRILKNKIYVLPESFEDLFSEIKMLEYCAPFCKLFKRSLLSKTSLFCQSATCGEDYIFFLNYLRCCRIIVVSDSINYSYNIHQDSLSRTIHPYVVEWESFQNFYKASIDFEKCFNKPVVTHQIGCNIAYFVVSRLWPALYKTNLSFKQRIHFLNRLDDSQMYYVCQFYKPIGIVGKVLKLLFCKKKFRLFDAFMNNFY